MLGFVFGTACLVGLFAVVGGRRRNACGGGRWGHGGPWGHPGWRQRGDGPRGPWEEGPMADGPRGDGFARALGEVLKRRLRIDDEQEGIVDHALADLRAALKDLAAAVKDTRAPLATAFRGEKVDDGSIAAAFGSHDESLARARRDVVSALKQIHAVLTPEQRAQAADWLAAGDGRWV